VTLTRRTVLEPLVTNGTLVEFQVGVDEEVSPHLGLVVESLAAHFALVGDFVGVVDSLVLIEGVRVTGSLSAQVAYHLLTGCRVSSADMLVEVSLSKEGFPTLGAGEGAFRSMLSGVVAIEGGLDCRLEVTLVAHDVVVGQFPLARDDVVGQRDGFHAFVAVWALPHLIRRSAAIELMLRQMLEIIDGGVELG